MRRAAVLALLAVAACRAAPPAPAGTSAPVVVLIPIGPASLDPNAANEEFAFSVMANVYESLFDTDENLALRAGLARSWETPDDGTWVFELRPGVSFHDGRPLDAASVVKALEAARRTSTFVNYQDSIEAIQATGPMTVTVRARVPAVGRRLAAAAIAIPSQQGGLVGTGPYRVASWTPRGDTRLAAFPGYWGGVPEVAELVFRARPAVADRLEEMRAGRADLMLDVPASEMPSLVAKSGLRTQSRRGLRIIYLGMDCQTPPFSNPMVRRAIALAIDRKRLVSGPLGGQAHLAHQMVAPEVAGFDPKLEPIPYDPAEARSLLLDAGVPSTFATTLDYPADKYRAIPDVAAAVAADLASVGINARPRPADSATFFERLDRYESELFLSGWMTTTDAGLSYEYLFHSPSGPYGQDNSTRYKRAEVDEALRRTRETDKPERRHALLSAVARRLREDMPVVPLYQQADLYAVSDRIEFRPRLDRGVRGAALRLRAPLEPAAERF